MAPYPFEVNPSNQEPFIRLRNHPNIIITPPRITDIPSVIPHLNDERIHVWFTTPFPYSAEHARKWITRMKADCDLGLQELIDARKNDKSVTLSHLPVEFLREIQEDGTDVILGHIGVFRCSEILLENAKHDVATNSSLPVGHSDIIWTIGDWLVPSHHRKGIMSDAVDTVINDLAKPLLGAMHFSALVFGGNEGSNKVFLKNGFVLVRHIAGYKEVKGILRDLNVFERYDGE